MGMPCNIDRSLIKTRGLLISNELETRECSYHGDTSAILIVAARGTFFHPRIILLLDCWICQGLPGRSILAPRTSARSFFHACIVSSQDDNWIVLEKKKMKRETERLYKIRTFPLRLESFDSAKSSVGYCLARAVIIEIMQSFIADIHNNEM